MFDPNEPASPVTEFEPNGTCKEYRGLSKFEQCAKDFTAVCLTIGNQQFPENEDAAIQTAVRIGMKAAEEFCRQMEERERNV